MFKFLTWGKNCKLIYLKKCVLAFLLQEASYFMDTFKREGKPTFFLSLFESDLKKFSEVQKKWEN